jgi:8-oxo-dGTP pyrophosphatase MutT (NUDIX family)
MSKPVTPLVGCDVFVTDEVRRVLFIRRSDDGLWALPGGCQDVNETPMECAVRECFEETGFSIRCTRLLGVFSSRRYAYVHYPWKENQFCHMLFQGVLVGGQARESNETSALGFFARNALPDLSDGHQPRVDFGFRVLEEPSLSPYFE